MQEEKYVRFPLRVQAEFPPAAADLAKVVPVRFYWQGRAWKVDEVVDRMAGPSLKAGGTGIRYRCRVSWQQPGGEVISRVCEIWFDPDELDWFVELPAKHLPPDEGQPP